MKNSRFLHTVFSVLSFTCVFLAASNASALEPLPAFPPIPADNPMSDAKVALGKQLFFDKRLSVDGTVSCNTCHNVRAGGVDNLQFSQGVNGALGGRNAPTVWNAAFLSVQFWDGRAPSLEEQAKGPMINPVEMGNPNHDVIVERLRAIPGYANAFAEVFGSENALNIDNLAKAIAAYERTLITPGSPVDRFLGGDTAALSPAAKRGLEKFEIIGCASCHNGPNYAGPMRPEGTGYYRKFPLIAGSDFEAIYDLKRDLGRYLVVEPMEERFKNVWRVPTLRNIALTAPYFHNGSVNSLAEAVRVMAKTQLAVDLEAEDIADLVAFLEGLTGERPAQAEPELPQ